MLLPIILILHIYIINVNKERDNTPSDIHKFIITIGPLPMPRAKHEGRERRNYA
jgi:hypothetical protein